MPRRPRPLRPRSRRPAGPDRDGNRASWWRRSVAAAAAVVGALLVGQLVAGALQVGVTVDEPTHVGRTEQWLTTGWYLPEDMTVDGMPDPDNDLATPFVYGAAYSSLAHTANVVVGTESWGEVSRSAPAYAVRHLVVVALAIGTAAAVGVAVAAVTHDRVAGAWGAAGLLAIPVWTGHAMFNVKDVPTAAGYTLLTTALMLALSRLPRSSPAASGPPAVPAPAVDPTMSPSPEQPDPGMPRGRHVNVALLAVAGTFFGVGTRTAMWVPMGLSVVAYVGLVVWSQRDLRATWRASVGPVAGFVVGVLAVAALHPRHAVTPVRWLIGAVVDSSTYPWSGYTLTAGQLLSEDPPWWYLPGWVGASIPLVITGLVLVGFVVIVHALARPEGSLAPARGLSDPRRAAPVLAVQQALLLPSVAMATGAVLYTGMRQHLYLLPALAIIAGIDVADLLRRVPDLDDRRAVPRRTAVAVCGLLVLALAKPTIEQFQLHPYNYAYVNAVAGVGGIDGVWETDYWGASNREAFHRVPADTDLRCSNWLIRPWADDPEPGLGDCGGRHAPFQDEIGRASTRPADDRVWVVGRVRGGNTVPDGCTMADNVTRPLRTQEILLSYVLACDPTVAD